MKVALTIAGSDCSGGAGIQADLKTFLMHGVYGMSVVTALTAQNTTGVYGVVEPEPAFLASQLDCVFQDIFPDAVKIGMMPSVQAVQVTAEKLRQYRPAHVVIDPVMVSTSGRCLMSAQAIEAAQQELFPLAKVLTPNLPEAEALIGRPITSRAETEAVAAELSQRCGCAILLKGGHRVTDADDLLWQDGQGTWLSGVKVDNPNAHGTGCTLSSAIAANLANGLDLFQAVRRAKAYLTAALGAGLDLGRGPGPLDHTLGGRTKRTQAFFDFLEEQS